MNCEKYQDLLSDLIDGSLTPRDCEEIEAHLSACDECALARTDLRAIVDFCHDHRNEYEAVPNERAMWLRISNVIEAESGNRKAAEAVPAGTGWWFRLVNRSWQLTFPQFATSMALTMLLAVVLTVVGLRLFGKAGGVTGAGVPLGADVSSVQDRYRQQQQIIDYWNKRVELNKARWSPEMRETFDRNLNVIDAAVNDSMGRLTKNPHDEVSEDILNAALSDKIALLKEFSDL